MSTQLSEAINTGKVHAKRGRSESGIEAPTILCGKPTLKIICHDANQNDWGTFIKPGEGQAIYLPYGI